MYVLKKMMFAFLALPFIAFAHVSSTGLHLLHTFWEDMAEHNIEAIEESMSSQFQAVTETGAHTRKGMLNIIAATTLPSYSLLNLDQTERGPLLIMTYTVRYNVDLQQYDHDQNDVYLTSWLQVGEDDWKLMSHTQIPRNPT